MQLVSDELRATLPGIGSGIETPLRETLVYLRLHDPAERWCWYILEADEEGTFFGFVVSSAAVVAGRFTQAELEGLRFNDDRGNETGVLRDESFCPVTMGELAKTESRLAEFLASQRPLKAVQDGVLVDLE